MLTHPPLHRRFWLGRRRWDAIRLSRQTPATIKTNLLWAFGYNVTAIPLAALGLLNLRLAHLHKHDQCQ